MSIIIKIPLIFHRKKITLNFLCIFCILLILVVTGCGDDYSSSYGNNNLSSTGSYACSLKWPEDVPTLESTSIVSSAIDCDAAGVVTVAFTFYDGSGSQLTGGQWSCSLHVGTVSGIRTGTDRQLVVTGKDASGTVLYRGKKTGIKIVAGQTTQGGEIEMVDVSETGTISGWPQSGDVFKFDDYVGVVSNIEAWWSINSLNPGRGWFYGYNSSTEAAHVTGKSRISEITDASIYNYSSWSVGPVDEGDFVLFHNVDTGYYAAIRVVDIYGSTLATAKLDATWYFQSNGSSSFSSFASLDPSTPTNVTATAGDQQVTISWDSVSGATSYNMYWSTSSGVSKTDYEGKIEDITTASYTHTGLTNGTTYYYVVAAENSYGESDESSEVSVTPIAIGTNTSPTATITSPSNGSTYTEGDTISFSGTGEDAEDGTLSGASLVWTSSIDGEIGTGTSFTRDDLSAGTHTITLAATDSDGATGSDSITVTVVPGMTFELIPAGTFTMGSPTDEPGRKSDETQHQVTLTKDFYIQTTGVTQGQWRAVMGSNPSYFSDCGDDCPVENVSWDDVQTFIEKLNEMEGTDKYRLPTEAEWEYACRAGSTTAFANGDISETGCGYDPNLEQMGWYCGNSVSKTHPVAQKEPNDWGLYDMHGNVYEWCQDWYGDYPTDPVTDPPGPSSGTYRVGRGGSWGSYAWCSRSANRDWDEPGYRGNLAGFRVARDF